ncbi:MAG: hypothetical protein Q8O92_06690 [Candidatus Latescibacter sp.]|nr:hypothetical protein [Candidatus Latescibacter sp.]
MPLKTIIVPVDGASNIKLEVFDFETLESVYSQGAATPVRQVDNLAYNATGEEFAWFDATIRSLPEKMKNCAVIAPAARGASGGLVGYDNTLVEAPGEGLTLSYTQRYPDAVEDRFCELAGSAEEFFLETGSIRDFPGSLTLIKRLLFEEMERPELLKKTAGFGTYGALMSGHFIGENYLYAVKKAGNEHSYWMCHSGARNIRERPGAPSSLAVKLSSFSRLIPRETAVVYRPLAFMPSGQAAVFGLSCPVTVIPGGHDTSLSHIPVISTFYQSFPEAAGNSVIQVEAGTWTMIARIGGFDKLASTGSASGRALSLSKCDKLSLPADGWRRDLLVQGTVDGEPVVTARYGGGNDFRHMKKLTESRGKIFSIGAGFDKLSQPWERLLLRMAEAADCFVLPNISPVNHGTGPFPELKGRIINEEFLFGVHGASYLATTLTTALTAAIQVEAISAERSAPLVITAGGAKDPLYGKLLATFTGHTVYALSDRNGNPVTETTALGAAIAGKAALMEIHPYQVDTAGFDIKYRQVNPFTGDSAQKLYRYREKWTSQMEVK